MGGASHFIPRDLGNPWKVLSRERGDLALVLPAEKAHEGGTRTDAGESVRRHCKVPTKDGGGLKPPWWGEVAGGSRISSGGTADALDVELESKRGSHGTAREPT